MAGVVTIAGAAMLLAGRAPVTPDVEASVPPAASGYMMLRRSGEIGDRQLPLIYAALP